MANFSELYDLVWNGYIHEIVSRRLDINCKNSLNRTVLHYVALRMPWYNGGADMMRVLVALGANVNAADMLGRTPLHAVILNDEAENVKILKTKLLVELGADVNATFENDVTSLHRAIQLQNMQGIKVLLSLGVDVNAPKDTNWSALTAAVTRGKIKLTECLAKLGADINSGSNRLVPLFQAVQSGRLDILKCLIAMGANNVNGEMIKNLTSVIMMAYMENHEMIERLAALGADLNEKLTKHSVVNEIVESGRVDMLECLVIMPTGKQICDQYETALNVAISKNNCALADTLIRSGADVNMRYKPFLHAFIVAMRQRDIAMVKTLVKLGVDIDDVLIPQTSTVLTHSVDVASPDMLKLLIKYGGDVNIRRSIAYPIHDAVARDDIEMVRVLAELGADMNVGKQVISSLENLLLNDSKNTAKIRLLVETKTDRNMCSYHKVAEIDLNMCQYHKVTALHDAVRLGKAEMVKALCAYKANVNVRKHEGPTSLLTAISINREDIVRYLIEKGADVNVKYESSVTPLNNAVRLGNIEIADSLIKYGASNANPSIILSPLTLAIETCDLKMVKCLLDCGANVNIKLTNKITPFSDAVKYSNTDMIALTEGNSVHPKIEGITPLFISVESVYGITEALLIAGADVTSRVFVLSPLDEACRQGTCESIKLLTELGHKRLEVQTTSLHQACTRGCTDLARMLIIKGNAVNILDSTGRKPLECLPFLDTADYHVLQEASFAEKVEEEVRAQFVSVAGCQEMTTLLHTLGIGDVHYISIPSAREVSAQVKDLLETQTQQSRKNQWRVKDIGSAAEGTKVGLPNEMDFQLVMKMEKNQQRKIVNLGHGYVKFGNYESAVTNQTEKLSDGTDQVQNVFRGSLHFHKDITEQMYYHIKSAETLNTDIKYISLMVNDDSMVNETNRKACSLYQLEWKDETTYFGIPVDIVPSLQVDNWPDGAATKTWLMDEHELRSRGYVLVPKPPHVDSDLAKLFTEEELQKSWKISFPHLETEHMQRLEQRIKDVYLMAKCLRNPDVCHILILEEGKLPRPADKYITSYQLKMCFFQNVEHFRQTDLSLEEMVCKVYSDLEDGLTKSFIPLFFLPKVNALGGIKLDVPQCAKVARIMARFVRGLYLRDCRSDTCMFSNDEDQEVIVYQRKHSSVYSTYRM